VSEVSSEGAADAEVDDAEAEGAEVDAAGGVHAAEAARAQTRQRLSTVFGWLAGGSLGVLLNYGIWSAVGEGYPVTYTTFLFFIPGAFGGMALADRWGPRAFKPLGVLAGVLFALFLGLVIAALMAPPE
jgi:hypothetical protein